MSFKKPSYTVKKEDDSVGMEFYSPAIIIAALGIIAMLAPIVAGGCDPEFHECPPGYYWDSFAGRCMPDYE
jgi:hypothetical protein